jgi:hypothetical protein
MYYFEHGTQPFGIKSPSLPLGWKEGEKFILNAPHKALADIIASRIKAWC